MTVGETKKTTVGDPIGNTLLVEVTVDPIDPFNAGVF